MNVVAATIMAMFFMIAPDKAYFRPEEPMTVRFMQSDQATAPKQAEVAGPRAADVPGLFAKAAAADVVDAGKPLFQVYTYPGGKLLEAKPQDKADGAGAVDVAAFYPQVREGGTYILAWKNATPLVINTLFNPGYSKADFAKIPPEELKSVPPEKLKDVEKMFSATVTHIEPLQYAVISTDKGDIKATFAYEASPHTVDNFIALSKDKFYDGSNFHRVIKGFMIQGGDSTSNIDGRAGSGGPGYQINDEFSDKLHVRGVLSMAHSGAPNSGGSQFFIMLDAKDYLDHNYAAFGQVIDGMDVVDKIAQTPVTGTNGAVDGPKPVIKSIRILPATLEMYGIKK